MASPFQRLVVTGRLCPPGPAFQEAGPCGGELRFERGVVTEQRLVDRRPDPRQDGHVLPVALVGHAVGVAEPGGRHRSQRFPDLGRSRS